MRSSPGTVSPGLGRFRLRLMLSMMALVTVMTGAVLYSAQRKLAETVDKELQREFQNQLSALHAIQALRHEALAEAGRALVRKPRIHAALEDNALDLLYPSARDELRDVVNSGGPSPSKEALRALFYRFLDQRGKVIPPASDLAAGKLSPEEEAALALPGLSMKDQIGYLLRTNSSGIETAVEMLASPIISSETGEPIAALVMGFKPVESSAERLSGMSSGLWLNGRLHFPTLSAAARLSLFDEAARVVENPGLGNSGLPVRIEEEPYLLFSQQLNPRSRFPAAYELSIFPLASMQARQKQLQWQIGGAGGLLMLAALAGSQFFSRRLSVPVEQLAVDSEENRLQRARAEAALELTNEGLQRSIRFSSDASHQLKTPVTVLRAGLEDLLARESLGQDAREEISGLIHQTYRLTSVIDDLLLLSRVDGGRLKLSLGPVDLSRLVDAGLDDLGALPDELGLSFESEVPPGFSIQGEERYTAIIVQNLLENARKYNRAGGRIGVRARKDEPWAFLIVGNTGPGIPPAMQEHIFERFHRGAAGENISGHGLGLNLARELARLHGGDLRLMQSANDWTEFEVRFRPAAGATFSA